MAWLFDKQGILAEGWSELIGIIVIFVLYAFGAIAKMLAKRSEKDEKAEVAETSYVVELAKKRAKQRQMQQQRTVKSKTLSEWDRLQEAKRRRQVQPPEWKKPQPESMQTPRAYQERPKPPSIQEDEYPVFVSVSGYQKQIPVSRKRQTVQQKYVNQLPKTLPKQQRKPVPASRRTQMPATSAIPTVYPLKVVLRQPNELRAAIILKEILDKPIALREELGGF